MADLRSNLGGEKDIIVIPSHVEPVEVWSVPIEPVGCVISYHFRTIRFVICSDL